MFGYSSVKRSVTSLLCVTGSVLCFANTAWTADFTESLVSAYRNNPGLMAERARVREMDENYVQAQAAGRFTVDIDGSVAIKRTGQQVAFLGSPVSSSSTDTPYAAQLSIIQPLYQGGRISGLKSQAKAGILAARQQLRDAEQNLLLNAATAYLDVLRDEETAGIRRNNVMVLGRQRTAAQDRFDVGAGTRTDIAQADSRLASAEIGLATADAQLAVSRAAYERYIGHIPQALHTPPDFVLPATLNNAKARGRVNNPQLVAARYNENAADAAIGIAKANGKPVFSLNGVLSGARETSINISRSEEASLTAQIRIPLYQGGNNRSRVRAAQQARIRSKFETREAELMVDQAIANIWAQYDAAKRVLASSQAQVSAAEVALTGVELEQRVGTRSTLDVLDAEQEFLDAKLAVVRAERDVRYASYQLLVAMGGFDAWSLQLPVDLYNPETNFRDVTKNRSSAGIWAPIERFSDSLSSLMEGEKDNIDDSQALTPTPTQAEQK